MKKLRLVILVFVLLALVGTQTAWASAPSAGKNVDAARRCAPAHAWACCKKACNWNCVCKRPPPPPPKPKNCRACYTVRRCDTLSSIAWRYGTTVRAIANKNGIRDPNRIYVGQRLCIPKRVVHRGCWNKCSR
jgi:LysM repeat protein